MSRYPVKEHSGVMRHDFKLAAISLAVLLTIGCNSKSSLLARDAASDTATGAGGTAGAGPTDGAADAGGCGPGFPVGSSRAERASCGGRGGWSGRVTRSARYRSTGTPTRLPYSVQEPS